MEEGLSGREFIGLYLFLKDHENDLDDTLSKLRTRIEKNLYETLSIDQFEQLGELYRSHVDVFGEKG